MPVGYRVYRQVQRPPREVLDSLQNARVTDLADAMNHCNVFSSAIRPIYSPIRRAVGPAVTVRVPTGDHLLIRNAVDLCTAGDVLVIDGKGDKTRAIWGGNASGALTRKQGAGVIVDGAVRDVGQTRSLDLPVFARSISPLAPSFVGPGEVNVPVSCGGAVVCPGDIIVADEEGIVVVPRLDVLAVIRRLRDVVAHEEDQRERILRGELDLRESAERQATTGPEVLDAAYEFVSDGDARSKRTSPRNAQSRRPTG